MDRAKTTARRDENHLRFRIWCVLYKRFYGNFMAQDVLLVRSETTVVGQAIENLHDIMCSKIPICVLLTVTSISRTSIPVPYHSMQVCKTISMA